PLALLPTRTQPTFILYCSRDHRELHSFPTRRFSDLSVGRGAARGRGAAALSRSTHAGAVVFKLTEQGPRYLLVEASGRRDRWVLDRKSTRLNSSHGSISYAVFCLKKKKTK